MNRVLDSRTDVYSLGCVLYDLLVGSAPFVSDDPMEVIHFHLAKACPDPVQQLQQRWGLSVKDKPEREREALQCLSAIIMKAVSKQAEDRYQSAAGMLADLDYALHLLTDFTLSSPRSKPNGIFDDATAPSSSSGSVHPPRAFTVGRTDVLSQFRLSQRLYGREEQVRVLLSAFARVSGDDPDVVYGDWTDQQSEDNHSLSAASTPSSSPSASPGYPSSPPHPSPTHLFNHPPQAPRPELVLIAGYSGIGKTSVVDEVQKPIVRKRGLFVRGKFDLYKRNTSVLLSAFRDLVLHLLTQDVGVWRVKLTGALGGRLRSSSTSSRSWSG